MTNLKKNLVLSTLLGSVAMLAVACGGGKESATPMRPNTRAAGAGINGAEVMKAFRAYKADSKLASGVSGATAQINASATAGLFDLSVKVLLHATSGELVGLSASAVGLEPNKPKTLEMDASCGNAKFEIEAMCSGATCLNVAVRVIEKPAANSPKISELEVGKQNPDTTGYAQTALVFTRANTQVVATAAQAARARVVARKAVVAGQVAQAEPTAISTITPSTPTKMVRRWSERWTSTADQDSAAGVKTTFEEAVALAKREGTNTSVADACIDPNAAAATQPTVTEAAAPTAEEPAATTAPATSGTTANGVSEINANPLN